MGEDRSKPHFGRENAEALLATGGGLLGDLAGNGPAEPDPWLGVEVGPFRIAEFLDAGGMSLVFRAERADGRFEQQVAVKILRAPDADKLSARFEQERQFLGRLEHPGIARIIDSGEARGHSWIAMELVEGEPVDVWCDRQRLSVDERLALFCRVAEAVQFAHGQLVIHRDIKPANVLVADDGTPRLLDFGIAKALSDVDQGGLTGQTMLLTPRYASPEQVMGEPTGVASDVYQLGLLLYRLLTGRDAQDLSSPSVADIQQVVVEREPLSPSRRVSDIGRQQAEEASQIARARRTSMDRLTRDLDGDMDAVVLKALEKEPARRYATALDMIRDIENFRASRPVLARPATRAYRLSRFASRHRGGFAVGVVLAIVVLGAMLQTWLAWRQTVAANLEARQQAETADAVAGFLSDLLAKADPRDTGTQEITVRELLDGSLERLDRLDDRPQVQAKLRLTMAEAYFALDGYARAETLVKPAIDWFEARGDADAQVKALSLLALARQYQADYGGAAEIARKALSIAEAGGNPAERYRAQASLATILVDQGQYEPAYELAREAVVHDIGEGEYEIRYNRGVLYNLLGTAASALGRYDQAEHHFKDGIEVTAGAQDQRAQELVLLSGLGTLYARQERFEEAEVELTRALDLADQVYSTPHQSMLTPVILLGQTQVKLGRLDAAEASFARAAEIIETVLGLDHPNYAMLLYYRTSLLERQGRLVEAELTLARALELGAATLGVDHPAILRFRYREAELALAGGRPGHARELLIGLRPEVVSVLGQEHPLLGEIDNATARTVDDDG